MAGQIFGGAPAKAPTTPPPPAPPPVKPPAPAPTPTPIKTAKPTPAFGQEAVLNGKPVQWGGKNYGWQSPESFSTLAAPTPSALDASFMGPGGDPAGSGAGQAQRLSQDVRPAALRDTISFAEGTAHEDGTPNYQMRYGDPKFSEGSLDTDAPHPLTPRPSPWGGSKGSNASGAYQFLDSTWSEMHGGSNLPMTPENQNAAMDRLIEQRTDYDYNVPFEDQIHTLSGQWASFPGKDGVSAYGQPVKDPQVLIDHYYDRLGIRQDAERRRVYGY